MSTLDGIAKYGIILWGGYQKETDAGDRSLLTDPDEQGEYMTIIIFLFVAGVLGGIYFYDRKLCTEFDKTIRSRYVVKDSYGDAKVTEGGSFLYYCPVGKRNAYRVWNLKMVSYISTFRDSYAFLDQNKFPVAGTFLFPYRKIKKYGDDGMRVQPGQNVEKVVEMILKIRPEIKRMQDGKEVQIGKETQIEKEAQDGGEIQP